MVNIISLNVNGLNSPLKRNLLYRDLRSVTPSIIFLQERHHRKTDSWRIQSRDYLVILRASGPQKKAGVAILIHKQIQFTIQRMVADPQGHYIIVYGTLHDIPLTLLNVYLPNRKPIRMLKKVLAKVNMADARNLVVGGDRLDRLGLAHNAAPRSAAQTSQHFRTLLKSYQLQDIWRIQHPTEKGYTFFSHSLQVNTRIDYLLLSSPLCSTLGQSKINQISWADHAPIEVKLDIHRHIKYRGPCRLNEHILKWPDMRDKLQSCIAEYFTLNESSVDSLNVLWEAHKANKLLRTRILEGDLKRAWDKHLSAPSVSRLARVMSLRTELKDLKVIEADKMLNKYKQLYYEKANRPHTLLARKLRAEQDLQTPQVIHTAQGRVCSPEAIATAFRSYYTDLYNLFPDPNSDGWAKLNMKFLSTLNLPKISEQDSEQLYAPITVEELETILKQMHIEQIPRPRWPSIWLLQNL
ncbi:hypothetical protein XELAEV_18021602mg [Xenopus laevis]|uniref:Endonuclease/exonuclease/phosphatase domain-containing protein n=1 Tax=Xenopus laevis TaxID=8355 RepID=A0A974D9V8_XENLA|nr:hypothetical protein XELAEV_18021602mg [Xenopus laevis]